MIRFCDKEVYCVMEDSIDRRQMMSYFMNGHRDDPVCILNGENQFVGSITYESLLGRDTEDSIVEDYLILDADIWENGRRYFANCHKAFVGAVMLPVLNKEHQLICFAWQDDEANREIRMLDELAEQERPLGFRDVFPEYDCVIVNGCNELAWYFVQYLKAQNVLVKVNGELWRELGVCENAEALDYKCLTVYAEGLGLKCEKAEQRDSVSVDFECIDRIYEENICARIIKDAAGGVEELRKRLQGKPVAIIGDGQEAMDAYDFLLACGIDIRCFIAEKSTLHTLLGKQVLKRIEAVKDLDKNMVFIDAGSKYSAWGFGETDLYHYLGYKRNHRYFALKDYVEVEKNGLLHVLKFIVQNSSEKLTLFGEPGLCLKLCQILQSEYDDIQGKIVYCDILGVYEETDIKIPQIMPEEISGENECLLLLSQYYNCFSDLARKLPYRKGLLAKYKELFQRYNIERVTEYDFENKAFMESDEECVILDKADRKVKAGKVLLGAIHTCNGNLFFKGIVQNHSDIYMIEDSYIRDNLFFLCMRLAEEMNCDILSVFWKLYDEMSLGNRERFPSEEKFNEQMDKMLSLKKKFTSQELFVMLHIAFAEMQGRSVQDISRMIIYWEPHIGSADAKECFAVWLKGASEQRYIVNVVRNAWIRAGSNFNITEKLSVVGTFMLFWALKFPTELEEKTYDGWKRIVMRFEDLKLKPQEELHAFCNLAGVEWSDSLLDVKTSWNGVTGFDLAPVYRTYEEYFSAFDRFRLSLITGPWQKKYGYPYVSCLAFSKRELKEMFSKKFRFEQIFVFQDEAEERTYLRWRRRLIRGCLQEVHRREIIGELGE